LEGDVLQQRVEAELIAARLFRFRARRGLGVLYSLLSVLPLLGLILYATVSPQLTIAGVVAGTLTVWFVARFYGFGGFSRMEYSLGFLKGQRGPTFDQDREGWLHRRTSFVWFLSSAWPWFGYTLASVEGYLYLAAAFLVVLVAEWVLIARFSHSPREDRILEGRVEDWAFGVGDVIIGIIAILPGAPEWTWVFASPLFVLCGTKSLYEAPKELALVVS